MINPGIKNSRPSLMKAFTLVEAVIAIVIISVMLVAALNTVGAARLSQQKTSQVSRGQMLAEALMSEILAQRYKEDISSTTLGPDSGESTGIRVDFDDVDDYDQWSAQPPEEKDGTQIPNLEQWTRAVTVDWVEAEDFDEIESSDSGVKLITVTVVNPNGITVAQLTAIRSDHGL
jgi:MSHA pilin protein MshD